MSDLTPVDAASLLLFGCAIIAIIVLLVIGSRRQIRVDAERHQAKHHPGAHPQRHAKAMGHDLGEAFDKVAFGGGKKPSKPKRRS